MQGNMAETYEAVYKIYVSIRQRCVAAAVHYFYEGVPPHKNKCCRRPQLGNSARQPEHTMTFSILCVLFGLFRGRHRLDLNNN